MSAPTPPTVPSMALDDATFHKLHTAGKKVREWTERRDEAIADAVAAGGSLRDVARAVGLSHTAVNFIANGRPER